MAAQMAAYATRHFNRDTKAALRIMPAMFSCKIPGYATGKSSFWQMINNQPTNQSTNQSINQSL